MSSQSDLAALKRLRGTMLDLLGMGVGVEEVRQYLENEHGVWVDDDTWAFFLRWTVPDGEVVTRLQKSASALSEASMDYVYERLLIAVAEVYARETWDGRATRAQYAELCRAVHALLREVVWWRCVALALAAFIGGLGVTVVGWLLRG